MPSTCSNKIHHHDRRMLRQNGVYDSNEPSETVSGKLDSCRILWRIYIELGETDSEDLIFLA